jgi:hypothetical protein
MEEIVACIPGEDDVLDLQLTDLLLFRQRRSLHILCIAHLLQLLQTCSHFARPKMGERKVCKVVPHCAVLEDMHPVLGPQNPLLEGLWRLVPGG